MVNRKSKIKSRKSIKNIRNTRKKLGGAAAIQKVSFKDLIRDGRVQKIPDSIDKNSYSTALFKRMNPGNHLDIPLDYVSYRTANEPKPYIPRWVPYNLNNEEYENLWVSTDGDHNTYPLILYMGDYLINITGLVDPSITVTGPNGQRLATYVNISHPPHKMNEFKDYYFSDLYHGNDPGPGPHFEHGAARNPYHNHERGTVEKAGSNSGFGMTSRPFDSISNARYGRHSGLRLYQPKTSNGRHEQLLATSKRLSRFNNGGLQRNHIIENKSQKNSRSRSRSR